MDEPFIDEYEVFSYKRLKNAYKLFCVGCVVFLVGFFFIFFGRPYTFDRTNKDLFFVFGLVFLIPGGLISLGASYLLLKLWKSSNDFVKLNKKPVFPEDVNPNVLTQASMDQQINELSKPTLEYSKFGINLNEPI